MNYRTLVSRSVSWDNASTLRPRIRPHCERKSSEKQRFARRPYSRGSSAVEVEGVPEGVSRLRERGAGGWGRGGGGRRRDSFRAANPYAITSLCGNVGGVKE
ncbi:hypothetical protein DMN91_008870 [Ooceraea biroi]|uniref:Uncharacterized protein n=1 Tax=Ooceraea biroi TaxID=2015173 RepID=A0A3L8DEE0_OOCBI|nr:uncharacterized protein LOC105276617 [Ooceraea biroi]RLU18513.1 hypothetical protein DMN91_008870 [Ooceraea biroi]